MKLYHYAGIFFVIVSFACSNDVKKTIIVKNDLPFQRQEVIAIPLNDLPGFVAGERWIVKSDDGKISAIQQWDVNGDAVADEVLFSAHVGPNETKKFYLSRSDEPATNENFTFARFVPERTDDYAWENDRVAFRTYGPTAQRMVEQNQKG